jgi:phospholipase/lecithinase/hemolysin
MSNPTPLTKEQIAQAKVLREKVIFQNGHVAFQIFNKYHLIAPIQIDSLSTPLNVMPAAVGFVNPEWAAIKEAVNDSVNPDSVKPVEIEIPIQVVPIVKPRPKLKLV